MLRKVVYIAEREIKSPILGKFLGMRTYALGNLFYKESFGKNTVDIERSQILYWSSTKSVEEMSEILHSLGYCVKFIIEGIPEKERDVRANYCLWGKDADGEWPITVYDDLTSAKRHYDKLIEHKGYVDKGIVPVNIYDVSNKKAERFFVIKTVAYVSIEGFKWANKINIKEKDVLTKVAEFNKTE